MKLGKWLKVLDPIGGNITIWTNNSDDKVPAYEGSLFDVPSYLAKCKIGRKDKDDDEPIYMVTEKNKHDVTIIHIIANVIEK